MNEEAERPQRTESGRAIEGIVFRDEPWIGWEWPTRTAFCERCGEVTEVPTAFLHQSLTRKLSRFHARHMRCDGQPKPHGEDDRQDLHVRQPRIQGEAINRVVFRPGNHLVTVKTTVVDGFLHHNPVVGVPAGIPFEVRGADPMGAWLYGPGYGMEPDGLGPRGKPTAIGRYTESGRVGWTTMTTILEWCRRSLCHNSPGPISLTGNDSGNAKRAFRSHRHNGGDLESLAAERGDIVSPKTRGGPKVPLPPEIPFPNSPNGRYSPPQCPFAPITC